MISCKWAKGFALLLAAMLLCSMACTPKPTEKATEKPSDTTAGKPQEQSQKPDVYKFGLVMPLTGSQAGFGQDQAESALMAVRDINAKGGVNGVPLKAVMEDSQASPARAITAYRKVVEVDKVPIVVTAWSAVVNALGPLACDDKVLLFSVGANAVGIKKIGDYVRTAYPLADVDIPALSRYAYEKLGKRRAAIIYINNDTGKYAAEIFKQTFEEMGGKVVAYESHEPDKLDFTAQIAKIKEGQPDVIHIQSLIQEIPQMVVQMRERGLDTQLTCYQAAETQQLVRQAGTAAEGLIYAVLTPDIEVPAIVEFYERWKKEKGVLPNSPNCKYLYDTPYIIKAVIERLNETNKDYTGENALKAILEVREFVTPLTAKIFFRDDRSVLKPVYIKKIQNGEFVPVETVFPE